MQTKPFQGWLFRGAGMDGLATELGPARSAEMEWYYGIVRELRGFRNRRDIVFIKHAKTPTRFAGEE